MFSMLHNQHVAIGKVRRHVQGILDWRRCVPISFHKDHRNLTNDFVAEFVTHVPAWPDIGGLEIATRIPLSQEFNRRISPQQELSPGSHSEARINQRADNYFLRLPGLPESEGRLRPFSVMSVIKRENKGGLVAAFFCGKGSLEILLTQADRYRLASLFILHPDMHGRCFEPRQNLSRCCHPSTLWQVASQSLLFLSSPAHSPHSSADVP